LKTFTNIAQQVQFSAILMKSILHRAIDGLSNASFKPFHKFCWKTEWETSPQAAE